METLFPTIKDIETAFLLTADYTRRHFPMISYKVLLTTVQDIDEVHGEIQEAQKKWAEPILVRAFAIPTEITQPLTKFGVEDLRRVVLNVSVPDLVTAGLAEMDNDFNVVLKCSLGDRFTYTNRDYSVLSFVPAKRWANTDKILFYQLDGEIYRDISERYSI